MFDVVKIPDLMHWQLKKTMKHPLDSHLGGPLYFHLTYSFQSGFHCSDQTEMHPLKLNLLHVIHPCKFHFFVWHQLTQAEAVVRYAYDVSPFLQTISYPKREIRLIAQKKNHVIFRYSTTHTWVLLEKSNAKIFAYAKGLALRHTQTIFLNFIGVLKMLQAVGKEKNEKALQKTKLTNLSLTTKPELIIVFCMFPQLILKCRWLQSIHFLNTRDPSLGFIQLFILI